MSEIPLDARHAITLREVKANPKVQALIVGANEVMRAMGYTEHGHRHAGVVSTITRQILERNGASARDAELGQIAAYLHDIGNVINRVDHPISGAGLAYQILTEMGMPPEEVAPILGAIGNHEELVGTPISAMSAALIIADKSDVHYSRVQNPILETYDIHDRVNAAVQKSRVEFGEANEIKLVLDIDISFATVMEYFEIFLTRMVMCRKAADVLGFRFALNVNGTELE
ncbi:MAG: HD domain-containing protein [Chthonomonas sp.]|nr:HD domain-containing protein [Chthonomonas sp.]